MSWKNYHPLYEPQDITLWFQRLKETLLLKFKQKRMSQTKKNLGSLFETGQTTEKNSYFYIKPFNDQGWLFSQSQTGWNISMAYNIVSQNKFIKNREIFDKIIIYKHRDDCDIILKTHLYSCCISYYLYEHTMAELLKLEVSNP